MPIMTDTPPTVEVTVTPPVATLTSWNVPWIPGARIDFDRAVEYVIALNGEIIVRSNTAVGFKVFPESFLQVTAGYASIWRNGMMKNPSNLSDPTLAFGQGDSGQGADQLADTAYTGAPYTKYSHALNVDSGANPNVNGGWVPVAAGEAASFQKAFMISNSQRPATQWQSVQEYMVISFMPTLPPANSIRPALGPVTKVSPGNINTINFDVLRNFTMPSGAPALGSNAKKMPRHVLTYLMGGQNMRRMAPKVQDEYTTYFSKERALECFTLLWNAPNASKADLFYKGITNGYDMLANYTATGWPGLVGAGQESGRFLMMALAAFALQDQALVDAAFAHRSNTLNQSIRVRASMVGWPSEWPFKANDANEQRWRQPLLPEHIGRWNWVSEGNSGNEANISSHHNARYFNQNYEPFLMENIFVCALHNGPSGQTGIEQMSASGFDYVLEQMDEMAVWTLGNMPPQWVLDTWALVKTAAGYTPTVHPPTQPANDGFFTAAAGAGAVDWTTGGANMTTTARTALSVGVSIDGGKSWYDQNLFPATSGTISGLLRGVAHFGRWWQVNAQGIGLTSLNSPLSGIKSTGAYNRLNTFTTTGTPVTAIPVFLAPATLAWEPVPIAGADVIRTCPATLPAGVTRVYVGFGYPVGGPIPALSYQIKSGGVDIGGASGSGFVPGAISKYSAFYDIPSTYAGTTLTVTVTATNSQGSATSTSAGVAVPGTQKRAGIVARGTPGLIPDGWTKRWGSGNLLNSFDVYGRVNTMTLKSRGGVAGNNFHTAASLPLIGSMASVPEGDITIFAPGSQAGSENYDYGIWCRCTGANEAAANGYMLNLAWIKTTGVSTLRIYRVVAGVRSVVASTVVTGFGFNIWQHMRFNWDIVGADLVLRGRVWRNPLNDATPYTNGDEPGTWDVTYTDNSPLTTGECGIGTIATNRDRDIGYVGFSTDPTLPAFLQPPYA